MNNDALWDGQGAPNWLFLLKQRYRALKCWVHFDTWQGSKKIHFPCFWHDFGQVIDAFFKF